MGIAIPEFVTYASNEAELRCALAAGADHLIIEDSKLAVRCYADDYSTSGFAKYQCLAELARSLRPDVQLSVNIDKLVHDRHHALLIAAAKAISAAGIDCIRVQDPGVALILAAQGDFRFHLNTETGNNNFNGAAYFSANQQLSFERQIVSNDWTAEALVAFKQTCVTAVEFQVHGPVLLQYTDRRLMAGHSVVRSVVQAGALADSSISNDPDLIPAMAQRLADVEGRAYPLFDNPHGHFMYASFDKALYKQIPRLIDCGLDAWLFDGRGESPDYLEQSLRLYRRALQSGVADEADYTALQDTARRSFKPGFFIANNTDYVFEAGAKEHAQRQVTARVVDSVKGVSLVLECLEPMRAGNYQIFTPEGKQKQLSIKVLRDLSDQVIACGAIGSFVKIKWLKGVYADCEFVQAPLSAEAEN